MTRILFDIISIQGSINGGAEFTFRVLEELITLKNIQIVGLYDSNIDFIGRKIDFYRKNLYDIIDINKYKNISDIIEKEYIDTFFIGIAQRYFNYNLKNIFCKTIIVIHDIGDIETYDNKISMLWKKEKRFQIKLLPHKTKKSPFDNYQKLICFCEQSNVDITTVSDYSRSSILYYFPQLSSKKIDILYPPMRKITIGKSIENETLKHFLLKKQSYFLLLNIHRKDKNAQMVLEVFKRFVSEYNSYLVTTGGGDKMFPQHINLPLLSPSDLGHVYKNAYALIFPSLQEGFGYPPLEAMEYGVPVISSNVCSMPIVLSNSALMFSPFYKNDLFMKLKMLGENYSFYKEQASIGYQTVTQKQQNDFQTLIKKIINE